MTFFLRLVFIEDLQSKNEHQEHTAEGAKLFAAVLHYLQKLPVV